MTKLTMEGEGQQIAVSVPLFLRKLWKMVNDQEAEDIIGWNSTGDGFVIYDQLQFITKLLPKYFKHNNMASFIRQLNFYDFHKVSGIDKDEIQFTHSCFLKDLPETLVFIRRKCTSLRSKLANNVKDEELSEILSGVKELKTKHSLIDNELKMLKQENAALWNEVNNLRLKHAKQTKIINKIIHFLISYMHSQNSISKGKVSVGRRNSQNLKTGPALLEIDYHNDGGVVQKKAKPNSYTFAEPGYSGAITFPSTKFESSSNMQPAERTLDDILSKVGATVDEKKGTMHLVRANVPENLKSTLEVQPNLSLNIKPDISEESNVGTSSLRNVKTKALKGTKPNLYSPVYKKKQVPVPSPVKYKILQNPRENLDLYVNNTQMEIDSLQDMLNNLNSIELTNLCNLIEDAERQSSMEVGNNADLTHISQERQEPQAISEEDLEGNDEFEKNSLVEELATLPMESSSENELLFSNNLKNEEYLNTLTVDPNTLNEPTSNDLESAQYNPESLVDIEPEVLADEYFTI